MLQLVADTIDGTLVVCDDGFVIESYINGLRADYIYDEDGNIEKVEIKNLDVKVIDGKLAASITN